MRIPAAATNHVGKCEAKVFDRAPGPFEHSSTRRNMLQSTISIEQTYSQRLGDLHE